MADYEGAAADYARSAVEGTLACDWVDVAGDKLAPRYVKLQCAEFLRMWTGDHPAYTVDRDLLRNIISVLSTLSMAKGPAAGKPIASAMAGFDWLIVTAAFCCVHRADETRRRYETMLLEICRKNGKTFIVAVMTLIAFFIEPDYSRFFSVAPDGDLAREIKQALDPLINVNEEMLLTETGACEFRITRDGIRDTVNNSTYVPLNYSTSRMDGREPSLFIADEIGALPSNYPIEAMRSGQLLILNRLGFCISTKYPTIDNPLEDEVAYAKKVLDGEVDDDTVFALLYEPDGTEWMTDDAVLAQGNPLALEIESIWEYLERKRTLAIERPSLRENFVTKHCNIIYQGAGTESYIPIEFVQAASAPAVDFRGRDVYVGVDLAMTNDNCAVAIAAEDDGDIIADAVAFIPADRIAEKTVSEKLDYRREIDAGNCVACGDMTVDYSVIEQFVETIETDYGCRVVSIGYDRWNALSSAQKWQNDGYQTVEIRQHSSVLHPPTKLLCEKAMSGEFHFRENRLLEINFQNAQCTYDTNNNRYVSKKRSNGKVDMVVALINAVYLLQQDVIFGDDWVFVSG